MISERMQKAIEALQQSFSKPKEPLSLADKLKQKVAEARNKEGQGQGKVVIFDQSYEDDFIKLMFQGIFKEHVYSGKIKSAEGREHLVTFKFFDKKCELISPGLFPAPLYIVSSKEAVAATKGHVWTVREFTNLLNAISIFPGRVRFI